MFFLETFAFYLPEEERVCTIHFALTTEAKDCKCYEEPGILDRRWSEPFAHYKEAIEEAKSPGMDMKVSRCEKCFKHYSRSSQDEVKVQVVVFAEGCVDPEIMVTLDKEYAMAWYLEKEFNLDLETDLLSWQQFGLQIALKEKG